MAWPRHFLLCMLSHHPRAFAIGQSLKPKLPWYVQTENRIGQKYTRIITGPLLSPSEFPLIKFFRQCNRGKMYKFSQLAHRGTEMKSTRLPDFQMILGTQGGQLRRRMGHASIGHGAALPQPSAGSGGVRRGSAANGVQRVIQLGLGL